MRRLDRGCHPKQVIAELSEDLLAHYAGRPLVDAYDVYQRLMDYWAETMQDDCYAVAADGWKAETARVLVKSNKGKEVDKGWSCDLVPKPLIVARYFAAEQARLDQLGAALESAGAELAELEEEEGGEDGAFAELDKVNKASVTARLREARAIYNVNGAADDETAALDKWLELSTREAELKRLLRDAEADLDAKAYAKYPTLSEAEVQTLVVDDKWLAALEAAIAGETERISQALTQRVKALAERYETPLPALAGRATELEGRVASHLQGAMQALLTGKQRLPGFSGEWEVKRLGDMFNISGGFSASRDQLSLEGYCYLHYGDIHTSSKAFIDVQSEYQDIPKLNIPVSKIPAASMLDDGDVVFVDASEDDEGTSKHVVIVNPNGIPFIAGLHTIVAKSRTNSLVPQYLRYCFQTLSVKAQFRFYAVGTKVYGISKSNIVKITIPVPSVAEQTAIAAVLSDMDAEMAALEAKLAKARQIKQGMMDELLTGRIRLV